MTYYDTSPEREGFFLVGRKLIGNSEAFRKYIIYSILYKKGGGVRGWQYLIARATKGIDMIPDYRQTYEISLLRF